MTVVVVVVALVIVVAVVSLVAVVILFLLALVVFSLVLFLIILYKKKTSFQCNTGPLRNKQTEYCPGLHVLFEKSSANPSALLLYYRSTISRFSANLRSSM